MSRIASAARVVVRLLPHAAAPVEVDSASVDFFAMTQHTDLAIASSTLPDLQLALYTRDDEPQCDDDDKDDATISRHPLLRHVLRLAGWTRFHGAYTAAMQSSDAYLVAVDGESGACVDTTVEMLAREFGIEW